MVEISALKSCSITTQNIWYFKYVQCPRIKCIHHVLWNTPAVGKTRQQETNFNERKESIFGRNEIHKFLGCYCNDFLNKT